MTAVMVQHVLEEVLEGIKCVIVAWVIELALWWLDLGLVLYLPLNLVWLVPSNEISVGAARGVKLG